MVKPKYQEWPVPFQDMQGYRNRYNLIDCERKKNNFCVF